MSDPSPRRLRYLALGDSYTIGESVTKPERWPAQLAELLRSSGIPVSNPQVIARTGWTTAELAAGIAESKLTPPYELISLLVGVNDQYRGYTQENYLEAFGALLDTAIRLAGKRPARVIVLSIPDWGSTPFGERDPRGPAAIAAEIRTFNSINRKRTAARGAHYVDIYPLSQRARTEPNLTAADELHPSGSQYRLWAEAAFPAAAAALNG